MVSVLAVYGGLETMVTFTSNVTQGKIFLKEEVRAVLGGEGAEVEMIPNAFGVFAYPKGSDPARLMRTLDIIKADLENRSQI